MGTGPNVEIDDDGRIHIEPTAIGGLESIWIAGSPVGKMLHALNERVEQLETDIETVEAENEKLRAQLKTHRNRPVGSKKERAKRLARNEILRQIRAARTSDVVNGGSVEIGKVQDMALADGIELAYNTVDAAFEDLSTEWSCFEYRDGSGTASGDNKRLQAENGTIPDSLWKAYESETGGVSK